MMRDHLSEPRGKTMEKGKDKTTVTTAQNNEVFKSGADAFGSFFEKQAGVNKNMVKPEDKKNFAEARNYNTPRLG